MSSMMDVALSVARDLDLPVFPCRETLNKGKVAKSPYTSNGFKDASTDLGKIYKWWKQYPKALIGVPTGEKSKIFGIDIDQSDDKNGEASFSALGIPDPKTCQTLTVSGGRHIIFKYPDGHDLRNTTSGILGKNIDTRGNGGYLIWAGSETVLGDYSYRKGFSYYDVGFQHLPEELLSLLLNERKNPSKTLFSELPIPKGQRNDTIFMEGVTLANHGVSDELVTNHVLARALNCEGNIDNSEVRSIQKSALRYKDNTIFPFTDLGNGERFAKDWEDDVIYCSDQKCWYTWSENHWKMNESRIRQCAKKTTRNMPIEAVHSTEMMQKLIAWQKTTESIARQNAMLEAASSDPKISRPYEVFTKDEHLFNLQNGTFNLNKQTLLEHRQEDYITKIANASLHQGTSCERWLSFIDEVTDGDVSLANFIQKMCGYMLSGNRNEQIILFLLGEGANGKSVFLDVLKHVFGSYAGVINAKALIDRNASSIPSDIAALANKRFVMMSEFPEHAPLNTATVKSVTGGDEITARHLYKEWFEFKPQFQVVCALNNMPKLTWVDAAFFRRVRIVPFERIFQPHERDNRLQTALKAEADGILRWTVEGYQLYKLEGLEPTSKMLDYLEEYMTNEDPVAQFVDTYLDTGTEQDFVPVQTMLDAVKEYCPRQGLDYPSETLVRRRLRELLGATVQRRCGQHQERTRGFVGYIVLNDREDDNPF